MDDIEMNDIEMDDVEMDDVEITMIEVIQLFVWLPLKSGTTYLTLYYLTSLLPHLK